MSRRFGSKTNQDGKEIRSNGSMPVMVGECVPGHTIEYFGMAKDQNGAEQSNVAEIRFRQANGALFVKKFWDSEQDWAIDNLNRDMLHICTKIVSKEEYYAAIENAEDTFKSFIETINQEIISKASEMKFSLKIVYRENKNENSSSFGQFFPALPNFPNWIELDGTTPSSFKTNPQYDFYEIPTATATSQVESVDSGEDDVF